MYRIYFNWITKTSMNTTFEQTKAQKSQIYIRTKCYKCTNQLTTTLSIILSYTIQTTHRCGTKIMKLYPKPPKPKHNLTQSTSPPELWRWCFPWWRRRSMNLSPLDRYTCFASRASTEHSDVGVGYRSRS